MSSTNKTPNLNLSQFLAEDIPAWLTDYNNDMEAIDTRVGEMDEGLSQSMKTAMYDADGSVSGAGGIRPFMEALSAGNNLIVNGGFDVAQRGDGSYIFTEKKMYGFDRWHNACVASTHTRVENTSPANTPFCLHVENSDSESEKPMAIQQPLETAIPVEQRVTVSFWVRASVEMEMEVANGGEIGIWDIDTEWTKVEQGFSGAAYVQVNAAGVQDENTWYEISAVMMNYGDGASEYRASDLSREILRCQRYYVAINPQAAFFGVSFDSNGGISYLSLATPMKSLPKLTDEVGANWSWMQNGKLINLSSVAVMDAIGTAQIRLNASYKTTSSDTIFHTATLLRGGDLEGIVGLDAEIYEDKVMEEIELPDPEAPVIEELEIEDPDFEVAGETDPDGEEGFEG